MATIKQLLLFYFGNNLNQNNNITLYDNNDNNKILISMNNLHNYTYYDFESSQSFILALFNQKIGTSKNIDGFNDIDVIRGKFDYSSNSRRFKETLIGNIKASKELYYDHKIHYVKDTLFTTIKRFIDDCRDIHTLNYDEFEQYLLYLVGDQPNFFNDSHQICKYIITKYHNEITDNVWDKMYTKSNYEMIERIVLNLYFEQNVDFTSNFFNRITVRSGENIGRVLTKINHKEDLYESYYLKLLKYYETIQPVASNKLVNYAKYNCRIVEYLISQPVINDNIFKLIDQFLIKNNNWKNLIYHDMGNRLYEQIINNNVNRVLVNFVTSNFVHVDEQLKPEQSVAVHFWLTNNEFDNFNNIYELYEKCNNENNCGKIIYVY